MKMVKNIFAGFLVLLFAVVPDIYGQSTAYGIDASAFPTINFASVPLPGGTPITTIGETSAGGQGGDFGPDSLFYGRSGDDLVTISLADGGISTIGTITGISAGQTIIGMGFDLANETMYLVTTDLSNTGSELYTLDLSTAAASRVGAITNATSVLAIAVNSAGDIFAFDDGGDNFLTVDPTTGAGTVVGPLTVASFAQDADFDAATGTLYWTFFDGGSGSLATVDVSTGLATPVTTWSADFIAFAILGESPPTSVGEPGIRVPSQFSLEQNYPNPFNPETVIKYQTTESSRIELAVYNLLGQKVRVLINEVKPAGSYEARWNGANDLGKVVSSGVYIYRLQSDNFERTKKMIFLR